MMQPDFKSIDAEIDQLPGQVVLSGALVMMFAAVGLRKIINSFLSPEEKLKRKKRRLISRIKHPSRSKFFGHARCMRQRFVRRRLRWS